MNGKLKFILFLIFFVSAFKSFSIETQSDALSKISKNVRCLICQGQTIDDSNSDFAINLKNLIKQKLKEGLEEEQIYEFLISKYGDWIILKPKFNYNNFLLWAFPYIIFILGGIYIFIRIKKKDEKK